MQYRNFGKLDWKVSALGFGCMRLPTTDEKAMSPNIAEAAAVHMIRFAIDEGVNYVDTAYPYHSGQSEVLVGRALQDGYREKVRLATKLPLWNVAGADDVDRLLDEQLAKLQTDHIDFYLLHSLNRRNWPDVVLKHGVLERVHAALRDGRIRHLGFSFHDEYPLFEEIVGSSDWTFCQIQYNYMDVENQAGVRGLKLAAEKGLAVVIMEPLLGGRLSNPPASIRAVLTAAGERRSPTSLALQWLWNQPEVGVVLSGMSDMEQVKENLEAADASRIGSFSAQDLAVVASAEQAFRARTAIPCTKCSYCMPCPNGVDIPRNIEVYNGAFLFDDVVTARRQYEWFVAPGAKANACIDCGVCEEQCPQHIPISEWMPKIHELLAPAA